MKMGISFVITLLFAIIVTLFAIQNANTVVISFLFGEFNISQTLVILISAALGAIIVLLMGIVKQVKQNMKIKSLNNENQEMKKEIDNLKREIDKITIIELSENMKEDMNQNIENENKYIKEDNDML